MTRISPSTFYSAFDGVCDDPLARWSALPLSWSQLASWEGNKQQWFSRYVLGKKGHTTKEMAFGNYVGDKLAEDPAFVPEIPRLEFFEYTIETTFSKVPLIGHFDNYAQQSLHEFKTGKEPWTQPRVNKHRQLDYYASLLWITDKIPPESLKIRLYWLQTEDCIDDNQELAIRLTEPILPVVFETSRTMLDVLKMLATITNARRDMHRYAVAQIAKICEN